MPSKAPSIAQSARSIRETPEVREARLAHERALIEEAEEDLRMGRYIEGKEAEEWLRRLASGEDVPFPGDPTEPASR